MYLEERVEHLEKENLDLRKRIESLEINGMDRFVSAGELAEIMGCSVNTVYVKIREGTIEATRRTGDHRIPMSQFYRKKEGKDGKEDKTVKIRQYQKKETPKDIKSLVFG